MKPQESENRHLNVMVYFTSLHLLFDLFFSLSDLICLYYHEQCLTFVLIE